MKIHKEGKGTLIYSLIVLFVINFGLIKLVENTLILYISFVCSVFIYIFLLRFFRNPVPNISFGENNVISPAEGKVVLIQKVKETEHTNEEMIQISVFMSPFNIHCNYSSIKGKVEYSKYHPGKYLVAWHPKSSLLNERTTIGIRGEKGHFVVLKQIAGALARRIVCYTKVGDAIKQGDQIGFIKFGSRVDVLVPLNSEIIVKVGEKVKACSCVLARLV